MNTTKTKSLVNLIERYNEIGNDASEVIKCKSKPEKLVLCTEDYNIHLHLNEYQELTHITKMLIEYVREVTDVKVAAVKKEIAKELEA